jgi:hypothetical protein
MAVPPDKQRGPASHRAPHRSDTAKYQIVDSVAGGRERHRQRQVQRLATIALVRATYGPRADARLVPPGPDMCPPSCPYCRRRVVVA